MDFDEKDFDELEYEKLEGHGKKNNQKLKPYIVYQYLMKKSDENNVVKAVEIAEHLKTLGISAERRSIYKDIEAINKTITMLEQNIPIDEVDEYLKEYEDEKIVVYDKHKKGFYVKQRHYDFNDIRLLAESIYSAKFMNQKDTNRLINVVSEFVSEKQAGKIKHNVLLTDRVKTDNLGVLNNIGLINNAMSKWLDGEPHKPEKIKFKYLYSTISDINQKIERRNGDWYFVSPYQLLINDSNYYLLAFDDKSQKMKTYRVDRMKDIRFTGEPRDGWEQFRQLDIKNYTQRVFSMFGGKEKRVMIQFINPLLDTVIDRFGKKEAQYSNVDDKHFCVNMKVEVSDQFFSWLLGFGKKAKLIYPDDVIEDFKAYIDKIREMY